MRGLLRRLPDLDLIRAQDVDEIRGVSDPALLAWAATNDRVVLTHDVATLAGHAYRRLAAGLPMLGVFEVSADLPIGVAIDELVLIARASESGEWEGQVRFLPL